MAEKICSSMNRSITLTSHMDQNNQENKDISKVFSKIRSKLNEKEKELLELQRSEPSLLAPDTEQIETLFNLISSIHLSTADGSFLVPSTQDDSSNRSTLTYPSTGIQTIKTLPSNIWLKEKSLQNPDEDTSALRLPLVSQLFSMSPKAFIASPSTMTTDVSPVNSMKINEMKNDQPTNRLPMVNELLSMPIDAFKPSNKSQSSDITTKVQILPPKPITTEEIQSKPVLSSSPSVPPPPPTTTVKSIFDVDSVYSKEFWLKKSEKATTSDESSRFDVEKYIEQTSEKMRRLHLEYVAALNQLKCPTTESDSTSTLKSIYPQVFDRMEPTLPIRARSAQSAASTK